MLVGLLLVATSCGTAEDSAKVVEQPQESVADESNNSIGKIILSDKGCAVKLILEDDNACYFPVNLDEKFKVDGAYLQFQKYPSRAPLPSGCESCRAIQLENVVRLKR